MGLAPILCHASKPAKRAGRVWSHSRGPMADSKPQQVPHLPRQSQNTRTHSQSCSNKSFIFPPPLPLPCSHHTGPLRSPALLMHFPPPPLSARGILIHSLRPGSDPLAALSGADPGALLCITISALCFQERQCKVSSRGQW